MGGTQFEDYLFCGAFSPLYLFNGSLFGTELLTAPPTPLVDKGATNNSMPMAVIDTPGGRTIAFPDNDAVCIRPREAHFTLRDPWSEYVTEFYCHRPVDTLSRLLKSLRCS